MTDIIYGYRIFLNEWDDDYHFSTPESMHQVVGVNLEKHLQNTLFEISNEQPVYIRQYSMTHKSKNNNAISVSEKFKWTSEMADNPVPYELNIRLIGTRQLLLTLLNSDGINIEIVEDKLRPISSGVFYGEIENGACVYIPLDSVRKTETQLLLIDTIPKLIDISEDTLITMLADFCSDSFNKTFQIIKKGDNYDLIILKSIKFNIPLSSM
jgi:hypothetical protein